MFFPYSVVENTQLQNITKRHRGGALSFYLACHTLSVCVWGFLVCVETERTTPHLKVAAPHCTHARSRSLARSLRVALSLTHRVIQAINDPFMDPKKLPTLEDLRGAPVRLSYHKVRRCLFFCSLFFGNL